MLSNDTLAEFGNGPSIESRKLAPLKLLDDGSQECKHSNSFEQPLTMTPDLNRLTRINGVLDDGQQSQLSPCRKHIWIVTGPAGSGKTSVGHYIAEQLNLPFIEGDDYHPAANKAKMAAGHPLTDADRWDWLISLRDAAVTALTADVSDVSRLSGVVLTCSALKRKYRDVIRIAAYEHPGISIHFLYLHADEAILLQRVTKRKGHYMKGGMVHSQIMTLEPPTRDERARDVVVVECGSASLDETEAHALRKVKDVMNDA